MKSKNMVFVLALAAALLSGCSRAEKSSEMKTGSNIIYVTRERTVSNALVYTSEKQNANYNQDELQADVETVVSEYNAAKGATGAKGERVPVSLQSCTLKDNTGNLVFDYATAADFVEFSAVTEDDTHTVTRMVVDSVAGIQAAGFLAAADMVKPDQSMAALADISGQPDLTAVVVDGSGTFQTEGTIAYVSSDGELLNEFTARFAEGTHYIIFE